jgi:hypothetical protein
MSVVSIIKAPWPVQLYRCLFTVSLVYFGSFLRLLHHGSPLSGIVVIAGFPIFSLIGLIAACMPIRVSRWIMAILGVLIPGVAFGGLFFFVLPDQGWFDRLFAFVFLFLILGVTVPWAYALFKDKKTVEYFGRRSNPALEPAE